ncbi:MAG TPA: hypothetical protein DCZ97_12595 [Syntrophus sp. (in: bacteria)]|nr:hypothetical protein [Syntrophus sp. (in: bacteria)]
MAEKKVKLKLADTPIIFFYSVLGWAIAGIVGTTGMLLTQLYGVPNRLAAQITTGITGLAGGLTYSILIRSTGGMISQKDVLSLSIVWALSCILGVTPLFFTSGIPLKMMVLTFYSFAIFGALGGIFTAYMMRSLYPNAASRDFIPSVIMWSFSFGFAGVASGIVGEGLQMFLPAWIAWSIAYEAMTLIIGCAGGYAIVQFLRAKNHEDRAFEAINACSSSGEKNNHRIIVLILLLFPFYLNDFSDIHVTDWRLWLFIDYVAVKLFPLLVVFWLIRTKKMNPLEFGFNISSITSFLVVFFIGALSGIFIEQNGYLFMNGIRGYPPLGRMPEITSPLWRWIDLTVGLLMVSIVEEIVFRGYLLTFLSRYTKSALTIIGISALAFGFIHWSGGFQKVIVTSAIGGVFMILYLRTYSLPAIILAHFAVNFVNFSEVIPKSLFSFY